MEYDREKSPNPSFQRDALRAAHPSILTLGIRGTTSATDQHYATLLAPVYTWMAGGAEHAFSLGRADLEAILPAGSLAVDLGAGFGMQPVPLARICRLCLDSHVYMFHISLLKRFANSGRHRIYGEGAIMSNAIGNLETAYQHTQTRTGASDT